MTIHPSAKPPNFQIVAAIVLLACLVSACAGLPSSGPPSAALEPAAGGAVRVLDIDEAAIGRLRDGERGALLSAVFADAGPERYAIGAGDVVEVTVWEAPPAALFGGGPADPRQGPASSRAIAFPEQMVERDGSISIPFAGQIQAAGRSPQQLQAEIVRKLQGKANLPQALVRVIRNNTAYVTVVGEVAASTRMPLTARGERVLDALAAAGGVRQPVNKMTLQLTRGMRVQDLPLDAVIRDPRQNIALRPGDVLTLLYQPLSLSVLGAAGKNQEISFETQGISLAQALARAGGLDDARADASGVFLFRLEPAARTPVVYRLDLRRPDSFLLAQRFPVRDHDLLFVSTAPAVELQKFLNIVLTAAYPLANVATVVK